MTKDQVGWAISNQHYIKDLNFARNPGLKSATLEDKIPLFKHSDLILKPNGCIFEKEIGITQNENGQRMYEPKLALQQGYDPIDIQNNPDKYFHFIITDGKQKIFEFNKNATQK